MSKRREFSRAVYVEIAKRATVNGVTRCEKCGCAIARFEVHHTVEDALEVDKSAKLTAADGLLLCHPCHSELTRPFQTIIAKLKRVEAKHILGPPRSRGFSKAKREQYRQPRSLPEAPLYLTITEDA